jgi:hypothetical protein
MTTAAQQHPGDALTQIGRLPDVEAVVAVEQARAVAQVAAQVQVAQRFPRDLDRVRADVAAACDSYDLAEVAFWALPNRGQGMTVHVARELAVIWGNVDYGVHELRRDDTRGMSEIQAFCWDMQRNSRATRTFQVPHAITVTDKKTRRQSRQPIIDLADVYRNNQSVGARAMRECVFGTLPRELVNLAERSLRATLHKGPGKPLEQRRVDAVAWFAGRRVTRAQLERRVGRPLDAWTPEDVATLDVIARTIQRGETTADEQFDPAEPRVSVAELGVEDSPDAPAEPSQVAEPVGDQRPATQAMVGKVIGLLRDLDVEDDDAQRAWLAAELRRPVESRRDLTRGEASTCIQVLQVLIAERGEQPGGDA